jgi:lipopolysaccharide transport system permease protein
MLDEIWRYRHFIITSIRGELKARIARSYIGAGWFILQPMAQALIFAMVLSEVLGARLPHVDNKSAYAIYVLSGMAAWSFFSEIVNRSLTIFVDYSSSIKKIAFPRLCLPFIVLGSALVNHVMVLVASMILFATFGHYPGWAWFSLPLGVAVIAAFAFGIGIIAGVFNVFSRDVGQVVSIILQIWFWLTPIAYPPGTLPAQFTWISSVNPLVPIIAIYQRALLTYEWPDLGSLIVPLFVAVGLVVFAAVLFRRASPDLVDAL